MNADPRPCAKWRPADLPARIPDSNRLKLILSFDSPKTSVLHDHQENVLSRCKSIVADHRDRHRSDRSRQPSHRPSDCGGADCRAEGSGFEAAILAATQLRELPPKSIPLLLDGMQEVNPIAENWFRGLVFDLSRKAEGPPLAALKKYAMDRSRNPIGRGLAMELIRKQAADEADKLIAACLDDPSLPLREMAVEQAIGQAKQFAEAKEDVAAKRRYRQALTAARHPRQLSHILESLGKLGDEVKASEAFSMITEWKSVAPFDNVDGVGYDTVYPPESEFAATAAVDLSATYPGKTDRIEWQTVSASDEGVVDLAAAYNKEKGAVCYLYTEFAASQNLPAEVRLGCINANKVWMNGRELMANEVYHSGSHDRSVHRQM